jgi:putative ABC transport system ATP-binding protein
MIRLSHLQKEYRDGGEDVVTTALSDVSFEIQKGEFVAIMGPSGSGKSTLLHILDFLDRPTGGVYSFLGRDTSQLTDIELAHLRNQEMGFVFQAFNLLGRASVYDNVEIPLLYSQLLPSERAQHIEAAVASVGLTEKLYLPAGSLSGGQKQRVAIARALVNDPSIIFADEPTGNLDSKSGGQVMEILQELNQQGRTVVLVTHETYTASYAQRLIALRDGKLEKDEKITNRHRAGEFTK